jgi:hypothetical protein
LPDVPMTFGLSNCPRSPPPSEQDAAVSIRAVQKSSIGTARGGKYLKGNCISAAIAKTAQA